MLPKLSAQNETSLKVCPAGLECGPVRASQGGAVEKIVAAGGRETHNVGRWTASIKVEIYDITSDTWRTGGKFLAACVYNQFQNMRALAL